MRHVTLPPGESDRKFLPSRSGTVTLEVNRLFRPYDPSTGLTESQVRVTCRQLNPTSLRFLGLMRVRLVTALSKVGFTLGCSDCMDDGHAAWNDSLFSFSCGEVSVFNAAVIVLLYFVT